MLRLALSTAVVTMALAVPATAGGASYEALIERIARDARAGRPIVATIYVALCDAATQGVVVTKYPRLCTGEARRNLYWTTRGGLKGYLDHAGWQRLAYVEPRHGAVAARGIWRRNFVTGAALRAHGGPDRVDVVVVGLAYRGPAIERAVRDALRAVGRDDGGRLELAGTVIRYGGASHLVGFMGHDHFMDIDDPKPLLAEVGPGGETIKGTFALSCLSDTYFRPALTRPNSRILLLNTTLTYPSGWTVGGLLDGLISGSTAAEARRRAVRSFAERQGKPFSAASLQFVGD